VVGLPLCEVMQMLNRLGAITIADGRWLIAENVTD
jgi:hypothetical protein